MRPFSRGLREAGALMSDHGIRDERVLEKDESRVELELGVPASCDFFDGHFPHFKLLPAVGQFEIVSRLARKYFHTDNAILSIRRMKFSSPILPDAKVRLSMTLNGAKDSVTFTIRDAGNPETVHSSGSFSVRLA